MSFSVTAVVVSYNRADLLQECLTVPHEHHLGRNPHLFHGVGEQRTLQIRRTSPDYTAMSRENGGGCASCVPFPRVMALLASPAVWYG
jgi:hypothetical protein